MTVEIEPEKTCGTCSVLCMKVDMISERVEKQERALEDLQKKILPWKFVSLR